jgi:hypothetical protein
LWCPQVDSIFQRFNAFLRFSGRLVHDHSRYPDGGEWPSRRVNERKGHERFFPTAATFFSDRTAPLISPAQVQAVLPPSVSGSGTSSGGQPFVLVAF